MAALLLGLALFFGVHSVGIVAPDFRARAVRRLGEKVWKAAYGLKSLAGLGLMVYGFGLTRQAPVILYTPPAFARSLAVLLMVPVFPLMFAAYLPGRIRTAAKHPLLVAVKLWAFAHLLANGRLADVLLFGAFLAWAVADRISLKRRPPQQMRTAPAAPYNDALAVALGLVVYGVVVGWAHARLLGVSPLG